ncbi:collagen-binding protein [Dyadobacter frigoris]|nr:collagen-binding protein [Dyadobacter frigoris]
MASVSLLTGADSSYVQSTITNGDGQFLLKNIRSGSFRVLITFIGYRNISRPVVVVENAQVDIGTIRMTEQTNTLNEVVIKQERAPITVKQDTVEFNAGSFKTQPNAQVEELLSKLPGMEVSRDGSIKSNGQPVVKVLVDGKPFFGNDPKMATRNLPADIVDKVQVYDQSSDQSQFSGMDDGNRERTINITIKKDKGKGYFGQNAAGAGRSADGSATRYLGKLNVNRFNNRNNGPGQQISLIGQANNLNQQNFTLGDLPTPGGGPAGAVTSGSSNNSPTNIIEIKAAGLNYRNEGSRLKWGKRPEMAASYFVNQAVTTTDQQSRRENILPKNAFITDQNNYSKNNQTTHRFNGRFDIPLDSMTSIRFTPNLSWQTSAYSGKINSRSYRMTGDSINSGNTKTGSTANNLTGYNNILLMRKFQREGRSLSLNINSQLSNGETDILNQSTNTLYDSSTVNPANVNWLDQLSDQDSHSFQNTAKLSFTELLSLSKKLGFTYTLSKNRNRSNRFAFDFNELTGLYDQENQALSNRSSSSFNTHQLGTVFQTNRLRYSYTIGFDVQRSELDVNNLSASSKANKYYTHLLPNALFSFTFPGSKTLKLQYRSRLTAPSISQLQPVADNTNPLNIRIGNTSLRPEYYNSVNLTFNESSVSGSKSIFFYTNLNQSENRINSSASISSEGIQTTKPVNTKGYLAVSSFLSIGRKIHPPNLTLNLMTNGSFTKSASLVNDRSNISKNIVLGQGIRLQSAYNGRFDYGAQAIISYQTATYTLLSQQNTAFWSQYATADLHWRLPLNFVLTSELTYNATSGRSAGYNQKFTLWNSALSWQFQKTKQAEIRLQAFDLFNQNRSLVRNTGDSYIEDVHSQVLKRYFLISFVYNLRKFGV